MNIELHEVKRRNIPLQVVGLHRVAHSGLLNPVNPETTARYESWFDAFMNTARLAVREYMHAYTVVSNSRLRPLGIATIIRNARLHLQDEDLNAKVHDLDYNLVQTASTAAHNETARLLLEKSRQLAWEHGRAPIALGPERWSSREDAVHNICVTISTDNPAANIGFACLPELEKVNANYTDIDQDPDNLTKSGSSLSFYYGHEILTEKP
jgi:hypothetical protein